MNFGIIYLFIFILGTIVGSFLNVVALRWNTGLSISRGRSRCFSCSKNLAWYELVPLFSFIFLRGRCSGCKSKISWQYPLVEFLTGVIFLAIIYKNFYLLSLSPLYFILSTLLLFSIFSLLMVIAIYDFRHKIIPDTLSYAFSFFALIYLFFRFFSYGTLGQVTLLDFLAGPIFFTPFFLLWFFSKGKWIGLGDGKLALGIGFFLGFINGLSAIAMAFWIGAIFGLIFMGLGKLSKLKILGSGRLSLFTKNLTMKSEIPFAPFLIFGLVIAFFLVYDVLGITVFMQLW